MKTRKRILSFALALLMTALAFVPSLTTCISAAQNEISSTYYAKGNRIVDTYGSYKYNGMNIPYRVVTVTPSNNSSKLTYSVATVTKSAQAAFKAGVKNIVEIVTDTGLSFIPYAGTFYDVLKTASSIPASFSKESTISGAKETVTVDAKKSVVFVFIDWGGWKLAYASEKVYGYYTATVVSGVVCGVNMPHVTKSGEFSVGSISYNLKTCCDLVVKNHGGGLNGYPWKKINNVAVKNFDGSKLTKLATPAYTASDLGVKNVPTQG